jgi:hypothetical protein
MFSKQKKVRDESLFVFSYFTTKPLPLFGASWATPNTIAV